MDKWKYMKRKDPNKGNLLKDRVASVDEKMRESHLRWFGHV